MDGEPGCKALRDKKHVTWLMAEGVPQCSEWGPLQNAPKVQMVKAALPVDMAEVLKKANDDPKMGELLGRCLEWIQGEWIVPHPYKPLPEGEYRTQSGRVEVFTEDGRLMVDDRNEEWRISWDDYCKWAAEHEICIWSKPDPEIA
jgi:hypothetical protein